MKLEQAVALETISAQKTKPFKCRVTREEISKKVIQRDSVSASIWADKWLSSKEFVLARVPVYMVASVKTNEIQAADAIRETPVVIDINKRGLSLKSVRKNRVAASAAGFRPLAVMLSGQTRRLRSLMQEDKYILAWVGAEAIKKLSIQADHQIGCMELQNELSEALREKMGGPSNGSSCGPIDYWIQEVYPFENYFIYQWQGEKYKQEYKLNKATRTVTLDGAPEKVVIEYVTAAGNGLGYEIKTQKPLLVKVSQYSDVPASNNLGVGFQQMGATNSERRNPGMLDYSILNEIVKEFLEKVKNGTYIPRDREAVAAVAPPGISKPTIHHVEKKYPGASGYKLLWYIHDRQKKAKKKKDMDSGMTAPAIAPLKPLIKAPTLTAPSSTMNAGGPGSGRKPEWAGATKGSYDEKSLNKMHDSMTKNGYVYNHSYGGREDGGAGGGRGSGIRTHVYYKGEPNSSEGRQIGEIHERANGRHSMSGQ